MNKQRAIEISNSPVMANVTYDGVPIYIQHVDEMKLFTSLHDLVLF